MASLCLKEIQQLPSDNQTSMLLSSQIKMDLSFDYQSFYALNNIRNHLEELKNLKEQTQAFQSLF